MIRVLLVDDKASIREEMRRLLELEEDIQVIGEAADGWEAIERTSALQPDLILTDEVMPSLDGIEATRRIKKDHPWVKIIFLVAEDGQRQEALQAGAEAYLLKDHGLDAVVGTIKEAMEPHPSAGESMYRAPGRLGRYLQDLLGRLPYRRYREREDRPRRLLGQSLALLTVLWGGVYLVWHASVINWDVWYVSLPFLGAEIMAFILALIFAADAWSPRFHRPEGLPVVDPTARVAVFITVCGEPREVVRRTIAAATEIDYQQKTLYILDDGNSEDVKALAQEHGCHYFARPSHDDAKARNLNYGLAHTDEEFVLVVDADQVVEPEIIDICLGYFQLPSPSGPSFAFVQTAQQYEVPPGDPFCSQDLVFYKAMQPAKDTQNAAISCGSGVMYRRQALESIGGFSTWNVVEDLHTSMCLHDKGWKSVYHNHPLSTGLAPEDVIGFYRQRKRWATDTLRMFFWDNPFRRRGLTLEQKLQYIELGWLYLVSGFAMPMYAFVPIWSLFTGNPVLLTDSWQYFALRIPYLALMLAAGIAMTYPAPFLKFYRIWVGLFPVHIVATFTALTSRKRKPPTDVASKEKVIHRNLPRDILLVSPQLIIIVLAFLAVLWGALGGATPFTLGNSFWCLFSAWVQLQVPIAALLPSEAERSSGGRRCEAFVRDHTP